MRPTFFRSAFAALAALALTAQALPVDERDLTTTIITTSCTANATTTISTTQTQATTTTTTSTALTTSTAHTTVTDKTTTTQVITQTAYVLANPPFDANQATPFATLPPGSLPTASPAAGGNGVQAGGSNAQAGGNDGQAGSNNAQTGSNTPAANGANSNSNGGGAIVPSPVQNAAQSSALSQAQQAAPTLMPSQPQNVNPTDLSNLKPTNSTPLSYVQGNTSTDGSQPYIFAEANATYQYPTVVLPHTNFVGSMVCTPNGLNVVFNDKTAYNFAKTNWKTVPFLLITESLHCNAADDGIHVYWLVSKLDFNDGSMTITVTAKEIAVEKALNKIDLIWGEYTPAGQTPGNSWGGSAPSSGSTTGGSGSSSGGSGGSGPNGSSTGTGSGTGSNGSGSGSGGSGSNGGGSTGSTSGSGSSGSTGGSNGSGSSGSGTGSGSGAGSTGGSGSTKPSGTYGPNSTLSCLNPPATYMGLPTAPCGEDFDSVLDTKLGFLDPNSAGFGDEFYPGDNNLGESNSTNTRRDLTQQWVNARHQKRLFGLDRAWKAVTSVVKSGIESAKTAIVNTVNTVVDKAKAGLDSLIEIAKEGLKAIGNPSFSKTFPINVGPGEASLKDSVFGTKNSYEIYTGTTKSDNGEATVSVYCVDCGIKGTTTLGGALGFSILPPAITKAEVGISGSLEAQANLGVAATGSYSRKDTKNIVTFAIPGAGIAIANIVTIGAAATLDATMTLDIKASGQVLVGVGMSIPDFKAKLDAVGSDSGISGFTPQFSKKFEAKGEMSAALGLGLPVEIAVGIKVPSIKIDKRIGLKNTPSVVASTNIKAAADQNGASAQLCYNIGVSDVFELDVFGKTTKLGDAIQKPNLFSDCFAVSAGTPPPSSGGGESGETPAPSTGGDGEIPPPSTGGDGGETTPPSSGSGGEETPAPSTGGNDNPAPSNGGEETPAPASGGEETPAPANGDGETPAPSQEEAAPESRRRFAPRGHVLPIRQADNSNTTNTNSTAPTSTSAASNSSSTDIEAPSFDFDDTDGNPNEDASGFDDDLNAALDGSSKTADEGDENSEFTYVSLKEISGQFTLANNEDGNLFLTDVSQAADYTYASFDNIVVGLGDDKVFFVYSDEITALGVSRFRVNDAEHIPKTADMISLVPLDADASTGTPGIYVAADTKGTVYYPVVCSIAEQESKIFLVLDPNAGPAILEKAELQPVITGGPVGSCTLLALQTSNDFAGF